MFHGFPCLSQYSAPAGVSFQLYWRDLAIAARGDVDIPATHEKRQSFPELPADVTAEFFLPRAWSARAGYLLLGHPPGEQHHGRPERRRNRRRNQAAAEREKRRDVIANKRAGNTHQYACDDAAG